MANTSVTPANHKAMGRTRAQAAATAPVVHQLLKLLPARYARHYHEILLKTAPKWFVKQCAFSFKGYDLDQQVSVSRKLLIDQNAQHAITTLFSAAPLLFNERIFHDDPLVQTAGDAKEPYSVNFVLGLEFLQAALFCLLHDEFASLNELCANVDSTALDALNNARELPFGHLHGESLRHSQDYALIVRNLSLLAVKLYYSSHASLRLEFILGLLLSEQGDKKQAARFLSHACKRYEALQLRDPEHFHHFVRTNADEIYFSDSGHALINTFSPYKVIYDAAPSETVLELVRALVKGDKKGKVDPHQCVFDDMPAAALLGDAAVSSIKKSAQEALATLAKGSKQYKDAKQVLAAFDAARKDKSLAATTAFAQCGIGGDAALSSIDIKQRLAQAKAQVEEKLQRKQHTVVGNINTLFVDDAVAKEIKESYPHGFDLSSSTQLQQSQQYTYFEELLPAQAYSAQQLEDVAYDEYAAMYAHAQQLLYTLNSSVQTAVQLPAVRLVDNQWQRDASLMHGGMGWSFAHMAHEFLSIYAYPRHLPDNVFNSLLWDNPQRLFDGSAENRLRVGLAMMFGPSGELWMLNPRHLNKKQKERPEDNTKLEFNGFAPGELTFHNLADSYAANSRGGIVVPLSLLSPTRLFHYQYAYMERLLRNRYSLVAKDYPQILSHVIAITQDVLLLSMEQVNEQILDKHSIFRSTIENALCLKLRAYVDGVKRKSDYAASLLVQGSTTSEVVAFVKQLYETYMRLWPQEQERLALSSSDADASASNESAATKTQGTGETSESDQEDFAFKAKKQRWADFELMRNHLQVAMLAYSVHFLRHQDLLEQVKCSNATGALKVQPTLDHLIVDHKTFNFSAQGKAGDTAEKKLLRQNDAEKVFSALAIYDFDEQMILLIPRADKHDVLSPFDNVRLLQDFGYTFESVITEDPTAYMAREIFAFQQFYDNDTIDLEEEQRTKAHEPFLEGGRFFSQQAQEHAAELGESIPHHSNFPCFNLMMSREGLSPRFQARLKQCPLKVLNALGQSYNRQLFQDLTPEEQVQFVKFAPAFAWFLQSLRAAIGLSCAPWLISSISFVETNKELSNVAEQFRTLMPNMELLDWPNSYRHAYGPYYKVYNFRENGGENPSYMQAFGPGIGTQEEALQKAQPAMQNDFVLKQLREDDTLFYMEFKSLPTFLFCLHLQERAGNVSDLYREFAYGCNAEQRETESQHYLELTQTQRHKWRQDVIYGRTCALPLLTYFTQEQWGIDDGWDLTRRTADVLRSRQQALSSGKVVPLSNIERDLNLCQEALQETMQAAKKNKVTMDLETSELALRERQARYEEQEAWSAECLPPPEPLELEFIFNGLSDQDFMDRYHYAAGFMVIPLPEALRLPEGVSVDPKLPSAAFSAEQLKLIDRMMIETRRYLNDPIISTNTKLGEVEIDCVGVAVGTECLYLDLLIWEQARLRDTLRGLRQVPVFKELQIEEMYLHYGRGHDLFPL